MLACLLSTLDSTTHHSVPLLNSRWRSLWSRPANRLHNVYWLCDIQTLFMHFELGDKYTVEMFFSITEMELDSLTYYFWLILAHFAAHFHAEGHAGRMWSLISAPRLTLHAYYCLFMAPLKTHSSEDTNICHCRRSSTRLHISSSLCALVCCNRHHFIHVRGD